SATSSTTSRPLPRWCRATSSSRAHRPAPARALIRHAGSSPATSSRSKPRVSACFATAWSTNNNERTITMTAMTGGEAIVSGLVAHGVNTVFGLPGAQVYGLFDAFHQAQLRVIGARHEQACGYMAFGYARSSGKPGVFSVVPGPGVLNAG